MPVNIWWIRRDLRLHDNPALSRALESGSKVVPLFILDPALLGSPFLGEKRLWFLFEGLRILQRDLQERGADLIIRKGNPKKVLGELAAETGAEVINAQEDFSPYARRRDMGIDSDSPLILTPGVVVRHPEAVLKDDGAPYTVYTPFSRRWKGGYAPERVLPPPDRISIPEGILSDPIPDSPHLLTDLPFPPGEVEALRRLDAFVEGLGAPITAYEMQRNLVGENGTSGLSPYLRFGMLSPRLAVQRAMTALENSENKQAALGAETWLNELIWREFYISILYHFPFVREVSFRESYRNLRWENDETAFHAWCSGRTGFPLVDAGMRQLLEIGWIHNRARMVVASFLTKELLIDWRWGERWFMQHLVDGDPAANNGGWQWVAGTGTDAAPYFRIFNPITQSQKFDPDGVYIRRWVPELRNVPGTYVHEPWKMPEELQRQVGCIIGTDYPAPMIDRKWAKARTLAAFKSAREQI